MGFFVIQYHKKEGKCKKVFFHVPEKVSKNVGNSFNMYIP